MISNVIDIASARLRSGASTSPLPDAADRASALDVAHSWVVEAPAGSGKTGLLIQRFLALLASPQVTAPEQVLAITFTRAATEEMRTRIVSRLREASTGIPPTDDFERRTRELADEVLRRDRELDWLLLEHPRRLRIQTIDGLCADIVRSLPALAGGTATLQPTEDADALFREAAQRTLQRLGAPGDEALSLAIRDLLLHRDGDLAAVESLLANMLQHREQWSELIPFSAHVLTDDALDQQTLPRLNASLAQVIAHALGELHRLLPPGLLDRLTGLAAELALAPRHKTQPEHPLASCRDLPGPPIPHADDLTVWRALLRLLVTKTGTWRSGFNSNHVGIELSKEQRAELKALLESLHSHTSLERQIASCLKLPPALYPAADWRFAKSLFRVLHAAVAALNTVFLERGLADFAEFSIVARRALGSASDTGEPLPFPAGLRHLLVDEMQDTSSRQYDLFERLTKGWNGHTRTLFLVGDPKQSIYIFRQARVERFVQVLATQRLGGIPLGVLRLTANFRSQADLVHAANDAFTEVFTPSADIDGVRYTPATPMRPASPALDEHTSFSWHLHHLPPTDPPDKREQHRTRVADALSIRSIAEHWLARPLPPSRQRPWRLAILVQNRKALDLVTRQLRAEPALPFRAVKVEDLKGRREVLDLLALTRALLHPADRIAWLAILRAPWCGLELADLHLLTGADQPELRDRTVLSLLAERTPLLSPDARTRLARVSPILHRAFDLRDDLRLPELVHRTWIALGGNQLLSPAADANVHTLLRLLRSIDREQGFVDLAQLTRRVEKLRAASSTASAPLELMTIHGAKGLEWDVVFVPEMDRVAPASHSELLLWEELGTGDGILLAPVQRKGDDPTPLQNWLLHLQSTRLAAERRRLLYVAATRAREELHLFGSVAPTQSKLSAKSRSLLEAAWPAAHTHLSASPTLPASAVPAIVHSLAASTDPEPLPTPPRSAMVLERVSAAFAPEITLAPTAAATLRFTHRQASTAPAASLARPIGTVVHALLDQCARQAQAGVSLDTLAQAANTWSQRIHTLLREQGLGPQQTPRAAKRVHLAIIQTLGSPLGRWILAARPGARNELALTTWAETPHAYRIDRTFLAGPHPLIEGDTQLWIIDYKTSRQGDATLDSFFASEQARHREQLERYAGLCRSLTPAAARIALGLWFPFVQRLLWWHAPQPGALSVSPWHIAEDVAP